MALDTLRAELRSIGADAMLVTSHANVRYLSGFVGPGRASVLVTAERAVLLTEPIHGAEARLRAAIEVHVAPDWAEPLGTYLHGGRLAVEADHLSLSLASALTRLLGAEPIPTQGLIARARAVKTEREIRLLREAARITDAALRHVALYASPGRTELDVALELERRLRLEGADGVGEGATVRTGLRSAIPHSRPTTAEIREGELLVVGSGAVVQGYHAHVTRTWAMGTVPPSLARLLGIALEARDAVLSAARPGGTARRMDAAADEVLERHGLAGNARHDVGHGTGLEAQELPRIARDSDDTFAAGMVVAIGPGAYLPGVGGACVEDMAVITEQGHRLLSNAPRRLRKP